MSVSACERKKVERVCVQLGTELPVGSGLWLRGLGRCIRIYKRKSMLKTWVFQGIQEHTPGAASDTRGISKTITNLY